jgi:hypothetical protein
MPDLLNLLQFDNKPSLETSIQPKRTFDITRLPAIISNITRPEMLHIKIDKFDTFFVSV